MIVVVGAGVTPAPLNVIVTEPPPTGVPGFATQPLHPSPPPPPPHELNVAIIANASTANAIFRRRAGIWPAANATSTIANAAPNAIINSLIRSDPLGPAEGTDDDGAVVVIVRFAVAVPDDPTVTDAAPNTHAASEGKPEQSAAVSGIVPVKPFAAVNVSVVLPDSPGEPMVTSAGFPTTLNVGAATTFSAVVPVDPLKFASPL